ncbi:hypothetical protein [Sunxiuqinia indica]|uniref:hypothetical protein n=1 Tax=Sunxiuqinia indica TaxID=2692584 RepID=UPI0013576FAF|nr:hypothetical protein [Sunxiuqinia indica]
MKKLIIIVTALFFMAGYTANAQMMGQKNSQNKKQGMMMQKSDMMQAMMNSGMCPMCSKMMSQDMPMKKYGIMVNHLPNMQQQLSLNDDQVEQLYDLQAEFKKQQIDYQSELRKKKMKLKNLLGDMASANQIEKQMQDCTDTKISMKVAAYETAGKMKAVLNSDQKEQMKSMMQHEEGMMHKQGGMMQNHNNQ